MQTRKYQRADVCILNSVVINNQCKVINLLNLLVHKVGDSQLLGGSAI